MYNHVADQMVAAEVVEVINTPIWMDRSGDKCEQSLLLGCKVTDQISIPDMCILGDEVGGNLCMKGDGHIGGSLFWVERGNVAQRKVSKKDKKLR